MERENFYILLELPFDPPADDPAQIKSAIHSKHQEWTRLQDIPEQKSTAVKYLDLVSKIEEVMLDPEQRAMEAKEAKALGEKMATQFEAELKVFEAKGYLMPKELNALGKKYRSFGISRDDIHKLVTVPVTDTPPKAAGQSDILALEKEKMESIAANLKVLGLEDLYSFLKATPDISVEKLLKMSSDIHRDAFQSSTRTADTFATQMLAETTMDIFETEEKKTRYDLALKFSEKAALNTLIHDENSRAGYISSEALLKLVNFGVSTFGGSVLENEEYIRSYCAAYGFSVDAMNKHVQCPNCEEMNTADAASCASCGAPLKGDCPKCGTEFSGGVLACSNCGFAVGTMAKANEHIEQAEKAVVEGAWSAASRAIEHAANYWPNHPKINQIKEKINELESRNIDYLQTAEDLMAENRYYAAQRLMEEATLRNVSFPATTKKKIEGTLEDFELKIEALRKKDSVSYNNLADMLNYVADSIDLERMLAQYPPEPPARITTVIKGNHVQVDWSKSNSSGVIVYILVRKDGSVPLTAYDGDVVYQGNENSFFDETIPPLKSHYYSVFVKRGNSFSDIGAVAPLPVQIIPDVTNLRIVPADQGAQLTWNGVPQLSEVKLWRKIGGDEPKYKGDGVELECERIDGYTDMKLRNNSTYWYFVIARYEIDGQTVMSRGIAGKVTPQVLLSPIDQISFVKVDEDENRYIANWEGPPQNEIMLLTSQNKPEYHLGQTVKTSDLLFSNHRLDLENQTPNSALFSYEFSGEAYVFPVVVSGYYAVVGAIEYLTNVPNVENVSSKVIGENVYISFDWPDETIKEIVVAWKHGSYPKTVDDINTTTLRYSKEQYAQDRGIRILNLEKGSYHFKVFAGYETPSKSVIYSTGTAFLLDNTPHQELRYSFKYNKKLFSSSYNVTLTVRSDKEFIIPKVIIVGKVDSLPLNINDGEPMFEIERNQLISSSITYEYQTAKLEKNIYLRMFFQDDEMYGTYRPLPEKTMLLI